MQRRRGETLYWAILLLWALTAALLLILGWTHYHIVQGTRIDLARGLDIAGAVVGSFFANQPGIPFEEKPLALLIAQIMAPLVTVGAVILLGIRFFSERLRLARIARLRDHVAIYGATENGVAFALAERRRGKAVVLVDENPSDALHTLSELHGFELVEGDPGDSEIHGLVGLSNAERLIVAMNEDGRNLEIAMLSRKAVLGRRGDRGPLPANVAIRRRHLWRQLMRSDAIRRTRADFEMLPFTLSALAARRVLWDHALWRYAILREQKRLHIVIVGFEDYAEALIEHVPAASVHAGLGRPRFTILTAWPDRAQQRLSRACPGLSEIAEVSIRSFPLENGTLDNAMMGDIASTDGVTAVFICRSNGEAGLGLALDIRDRMLRSGLWGAPVFVRLDTCEGIAELLVDQHKARHFVDMIHPFGVEETLCDIEVLEGDLERLASRFHSAFQESGRTALRHSPGKGSPAALSDWRALDETFRQANRRAADHIPAKIASAGAIMPSGGHLKAVKGFALCRDEAERELLARLEHESWMAGRYADGWAHGAMRDDLRRLHPGLVPYDALDETGRQSDRAQVALLDRDLIERLADGRGRRDLIRRELKVGMLGKLLIDADEAEWIVRTLSDEVLPQLLADHPDHHYSLLSPLAPGASLCAVEAAIGRFDAADAAYGLLVPEAVPESVMINDYAALLAERTMPGEDPAEAAEAAGRRRQALIAGAFCEWVIDLRKPEEDPFDAAVRDRLYRREGDYLARHCDCLIAMTRQGGTGSPAQLAIGGTDDTITRRAALRHDAGRQDFILDLGNRSVARYRS